MYILLFAFCRFLCFLVEGFVSSSSLILLLLRNDIVCAGGKLVRPAHLALATFPPSLCVLLMTICTRGRERAETGYPPTLDTARSRFFFPFCRRSPLAGPFYFFFLFFLLHDLLFVALILFIRLRLRLRLTAPVPVKRSACQTSQPPSHPATQTQGNNVA